MSKLMAQVARKDGSVLTMSRAVAAGHYQDKAWRKDTLAVVTYDSSTYKVHKGWSNSRFPKNGALAEAKIRVALYDEEYKRASHGH